MTTATLAEARGALARTRPHLDSEAPHPDRPTSGPRYRASDRTRRRAERGRYGSRVALTGPLLDAYVTGDASGYGGDGSRLRAAVVMKLVSLGATLEECREVLLLTPGRDGTRLFTERRRNGETRPRRDYEALLRREYASAVRGHRDLASDAPTRAEVLARCGALRARLDATSFDARTDSTSRSVLLALVRRAERFGSLLVSASHGQVAVEARVGYRSVTRVLSRLVELGWVSVHTAPSADEAAVYRLSAPRDSGRDAPDALADDVEFFTSAVEDSDLYDSLPGAARRVLRLLDDVVPRSFADVLGQAGAPGRSSLYASLALLRLRGLARRTEDGRWVRDHRGDDAADAEGGEVADRRRGLIEAARARFAALRALLGLTRGWGPPGSALERLARSERRGRRVALGSPSGS